MNRKELEDFTKTRAKVAIQRLQDAFFLQKCMGGYHYRQRLKSTDMEVAAAVVASEKEIINTFADLIALQALCERSPILGSLILRKHRRLVDELTRQANESRKAGKPEAGKI